MCKVDIGKKFALEYLNFPPEDKKKIREFISHVKENGLKDLEGKISPSCKVPFETDDRHLKISFARRHKLWHYHIGIPVYKRSRCGRYLTSEYVLHYQKFSMKNIKIVDFSAHPPFNLPPTNYLN